MSVISQRALNRTLLERQFLAGRTTRQPLEVIRHLVAMQGQQPNGPYVGLWARLETFGRDDLAALLESRRVIRSTMLRRTVHLADAEDFRWLRPTIQPVVSSALKAAYYAKEISGLDLDELARTGSELLSGRTLSRREFGRLIGSRYPGRHGGRLADSVEIMVPLVHAPEVGAWCGWGHPSNVAVALADEQIGRTIGGAPQIETMIERYLAAFGPATVMDIQAWSGLTRLREPVEAMRARLRVFENEDGKELFDLPDAPIADADQPVPVRFLPAFDNALLGHRDRTRVISDADRKRYSHVASGGTPMLLVDGFVQGTWSVAGSTVFVAPSRPLATEDTAAVVEEGERLLNFIAPDDSERALVFVDDGDMPVNKLHAGMRAKSDGS